MNPLTEYWQERYEERAAIMEYDAKMKPDEANAAAWSDIQRQILLSGGVANAS